MNQISSQVRYESSYLIFGRSVGGIPWTYLHIVGGSHKIYLTNHTKVSLSFHFLFFFSPFSEADILQKKITLWYQEFRELTNLRFSNKVMELFDVSPKSPRKQVEINSWLLLIHTF